VAGVINCELVIIAHSSEEFVKNLGYRTMAYFDPYHISTPPHDRETNKMCLLMVSNKDVLIVQFFPAGMRTFLTWRFRQVR
jgi:hypothetical protein